MAKYHVRHGAYGIDAGILDEDGFWKECNDVTKECIRELCDYELEAMRQNGEKTRTYEQVYPDEGIRMTFERIEGHGRHGRKKQDEKAE